MTGAGSPRLDEVWAPYMEWAKRHPRPRYDLCGSNLRACRLEDLPGAATVVELNGDNDQGYAPLVEVIAARYGVDPDRVALASGASGANFLVMAALLAPGDEVLIERPAYDPLPGAARLLGARVRTFERPFEEGFGVAPERVAAAITERTRLVIVTDPHNPSGALLADGALAGLARLAEEHDLHVLVDEVYLDTVPSRRAPAASHGERMVTTSSLTKAYGLAGLRAGWVLATPRVAAAVRRVRGTTEAIGAFPAEALAALAFEHIEALAARSRAILEPGLRQLVGFVDSRPELAWVRPGGGTVGFPRLRETEDAGPFIERLLVDFETSVVPGRFFSAPAHFRVAFGGDADALAGGLDQVGRALDTL